MQNSLQVHCEYIQREACAVPQFIHVVDCLNQATYTIAIMFFFIRVKDRWN